MIDSYRLLLHEAALLYKKHEVGRPKPFNVFSVLRTESDEVNLHSRFLHALLNYKKSAEGKRENLTDFLHCIGVEGFELRGVKVERERDYIDILITNEAGQAIVIENKIWSGDPPQQLLRYHTTLTGQRYQSIHLLYLTPDKHDPSEDSAGGLDYETISYRDTLPPWLKRCQQRAYDEPELRESVAQYRQLVQKLTGTDSEREYMDALTTLCLEGNTLSLLCDFQNVLDNHVWPHLVFQELWSDIDVALKKEISDLPDRTDKGDREVDLEYPLGGGASLCVSAHRMELSYGVKCTKCKHMERYNALCKALRKMTGGIATAQWPWWYHPYHLRVRDSTPNRLIKLANEAKRKENAKSIAQALKRLWEEVRDRNLLELPPKHVDTETAS